MNNTMSNRPQSFLLALFGAIFVGLALSASADVIDEQGNAIPVASAEAILEASGLDRLAARADYVVHARVGAQSAAWVNKNIETSSMIAVENKLKGDGPDQFELTVLGGDAPDGLPVGQYVRGAARLFEGEEVILFLKTDTQQRVNEVNARRASNGLEPIRVAPESKLATSFRVVGGLKGKFNVITLSDGSKFVTRFRPMPQMLSKPVIDIMESEMRKGLESVATKEQRQEQARLEWEAAADRWAEEYGVRPILPEAAHDSGPATAAGGGALRLAGAAEPVAPRAARMGGVPAGSTAATEAEAPGGLPRDSYRPSIVTDPDAPELAPLDPKAMMKVLPHNADFHRRPMALDTFEALLRYQIRREAGAASAEPATAEAN
jgi:hypothetical protein